MDVEYGDKWQPRDLYVFAICIPWMHVCVHLIAAVVSAAAAPRDLWIVLIEFFKENLNPCAAELCSSLFHSFEDGIATAIFSF